MWSSAWPVEWKPMWKALSQSRFLAVWRTQLLALHSASERQYRLVVIPRPIVLPGNLSDCWGHSRELEWATQQAWGSPSNQMLLLHHHEQPSQLEVLVTSGKPPSGHLQPCWGVAAEISSSCLLELQEYHWWDVWCQWWMSFPASPQLKPSHNPSTKANIQPLAQPLSPQPPKCCYFVVVGGLACLADPRGYASWSFNSW